MSTELQGFHYYQEKYKVQQYSFSLSQKLHKETLITKIMISIFNTQDSQWATKRAKIFFQGTLPPDPQKACP